MRERKMMIVGRVLHGQRKHEQQEVVELRSARASFKAPFVNCEANVVVFSYYDFFAPRPRPRPPRRPRIILSFYS